MPDPQADKAGIGLEVEIETRGVNILALLVSELNTDSSLVWALVLGNPHITIDAKQ